MAFTVPSFEHINFEIPNGKGGTVELSVPPLDCLEPVDVEKMNASLQEIPEDTPQIRNPNVNPTALIQHMLAYYATRKEQREAIWSLVPRQVKALNEHWEANSELRLGESEPSTESSSETAE